MKAAGLNPMLAYSQGGAAAPVGVAAQSQNIFSGAADAFNSTKQTDSNVKKQDQDINTSSAKEAETKENTLKIIEEKLNRIEERERTRAETQNLKESNNEIKARVDNLLAELPNILTKNGLLKAETFKANSAGDLNLAVRDKTRQNFTIDTPQERYGASKYGQINYGVQQGLSSAKAAADVILPFRGRTTNTTTRDSRGNTSNTRTETR